MIELQPQGFRPEPLTMPSLNQIQIGEQVFTVRDIEADELLNPETGYAPNVDVRVTVLEFDDEDLAATMDAAILTIAPEKATPIQRWLKPDNNPGRTFIEKPIGGSGTWIGVNPDGDVVQYDFNEESLDEPGLIVYGPGWIGNWIAGEEGLEILEICVPAYQDDGTTLVARSEDIVFPADLEKGFPGAEIPIAFQALHLSLVEIVEALDVTPSEPIVIHDALTIIEYLTQDTSPEMSVAEVTLNGENQAVSNLISDAAYCVKEGFGTFKIWEEDEPVVIEVGQGSVVIIPAGTRYQDSGNMKLVVVNRPAFDPEQVQTFN